MEIGKEMIYDRLPKSILNRVVWRKDYWLTDEALTIQVRDLGPAILKITQNPK